MYKIPANLGFPSNQVHYLPTCHSTNEIMTNLLASGVEEGYIVITDFQSAGKGQPGKSWETQPYKNLTFSLLLKPSFLKLENQFRLTQVISLSVAGVVQNYLSEIVHVKWPNDIYVKEGKIAGILIQNSVKNRVFESCIVGIGLNVNQDVFETPEATSLKGITGKSYDINAILAQLIEEISERYSLLREGNFSLLNDEYQELLYAKNQLKVFESDKRFYGEIIGTDQVGRLLVQTLDGIKSFQNQEVKLVRG